MKSNFVFRPDFGVCTYNSDLQQPLSRCWGVYVLYALVLYCLFQEMPTYIGEAQSILNQKHKTGGPPPKPTAQGCGSTSKVGGQTSGC